jgi:serine protease AprX
MNVALAVGWDDKKKGRFGGLVIVTMLGLSLPLATPSATSASFADVSEMVSVIVRELPGAGMVPEQIVAELGGKVTMQLGIIDGFAATLPTANVDALEASNVVRSVSFDRSLKTLDYADPDDMGTPGSPYSVAKSIKARDLWKDGYTGQGVDVAIIDTGVSPVAGLDAPGKIKAVADFSFEQANESLRFFDTNGHGTHLAGIIAGNDTGVADPNDKDNFVGVAPSAGLVNVKVGNAAGAADVSQVIAAIDWVVTHKNDPGLNIRVLNLAYGTDGTQDYRIDPLAYAAEVAWRNGIVVVAAAGNSGFGDEKLNNPASDPFVIAVGANDTKGTYGLGDDVTPDWTERGNAERNPDVVAPGKSLVSLRVENSQIDLTHPEGRLGTRYFKGSGTSQAAAVVSGAAALLLSQRPSLTPDQVKYLLRNNASSLPMADQRAQGEGLIDVKAAAKASTPSASQATQTFERSSGTGSLEASRGSTHVTDPDGNVLQGEVDIFGASWSGVGWSGVGWSGVGWSGTSWSGVGWSGVGWSGVGWSGVGWSGTSWSGVGWSGVGWSGVGWSGVGWSGVGWSGVGWS